MVTCRIRFLTTQKNIHNHREQLCSSASLLSVRYVHDHPSIPPRWPSGKASASRAEGPGFESRLRRDFFGVESYQWLALQWLPCQATGVIGSALGLVGPVSVYCDWVRWKVGSAASISVWQHVKLSEQICPWDTLACRWDVKQPTNQQTNIQVCKVS